MDGIYCMLKPSVLINNEDKESNLYNDSEEFLGNEESAQVIWALSQIPDVMKEIKLKNPNFELDKLGEPTLESMNKVLLLPNKMISLKGKAIELGAINKQGEPIKYNTLDEIIDKVTKFNQDNQNLVATVNKDGNKYIIVVNPKTIDNANEPNKLLFKYLLSKQLKGLLNSIGFNVKVDENLLEHGVFDPLNAETDINNLRTAIRIAKGVEGEKALPEEFSHLIIAGLQHEPLVERLLNNVTQEVIEYVLGDLYELYYNTYKGDFNLLRKEAAGKILANQISGKETFINNLPDRVWNKAKSNINKLDENDINDAINRANQGFARLSTAIMNESILPLLDYKAIENELRLYDLAPEVDKIELLANKTLELASKRLKILHARRKTNRYRSQEIEAIKKLKETIENKKYTKSCAIFLKSSLSEIERLQRQLDDLKKDENSISDSLSIRRMSRTLRNIKDFASAYDDIIKQMMSLDTMQKEGTVNLSEEDAAALSLEATKINKILNDISINYRELRFNTVLKFLKPYWGEDKLITFGKNKGEVLALDLLLKMADKDINGLDRWISSLSDASDPLLSLIDKVVKKTHLDRDKALLQGIEKIKAAENKLKNAGYTNDFMYERDSDGKLTGRIISNIDFIKYEKDLKAYKKSLEDLGLRPTTIDIKIRNWERKHTTVIETKEGFEYTIPNTNEYSTTKLNSLSAAQREYYDAMMKIKEELDSYIPKRYIGKYKAVQISNTTVQSLFGNNHNRSPKQLLSQLKDNFVKRTDETEYGEQVALTGFNGERIDKLPVFYTNGLKDMSRLSTDFSSSLLAYSSMALNYHTMNQVINQLELTRDVANDRLVQQWAGDKKLVETFSILGSKFSKNYTVAGSRSNIGIRLNEYFSSAIYNKYKEDEGSINIGKYKVDVTRLADSLGSYTGAIGLGINTFSGMANVLVGKMQLFIEEMSGEYFNFKNAQVGKKNYWALVKDVIAEINQSTKTNKLDLLSELFDVEGNFSESLKKQGLFENLFSRVMGNTNLYMLNNMGEHYLRNRCMLAMLDATKVKLNGKEVSLFEAYEVEKNEENGTVLSARIKLKDGVTKLDGSEFTELDFNNLKLKIKKVSDSLNGAFSNEDKGAIHRYALGRLAMQFRLWMPAHYYRRFAGKYYDALLDLWREGYYRTFGRFIINTLMDIRRAKFEFATNYANLSEHEKANINRALTEMTMFATLAIMCSGLGPIKDLKGRWADRLIAYNLYRMKLETGASFPINTDFFENIGSILYRPVPSIKSFNQLASVLEFWNMWNEIESGRYKGMSEWQRDVILTLPIYGQVRKVVDIADEDYMFTQFE